MKIQSNPTFEAKSRYISEEMSYNMNKLLRKMDADTLKTENKDFWRTKEVKSLTIPDEGSIKRGKFLVKRNEFEELIPYGEDTTMLEIGKSRLIINNRTDEIIEHKKPFYVTWSHLLKKASGLIISALNNYHNVNICHRTVITREGLTKAGAKKAEKEMRPFLNLIKGIQNLWSN